MLMVSLAFRNILRNRRRTLITLISMSGAFLLLVASISIQDGSYDQILKVFHQRLKTAIVLQQLSLMESQMWLIYHLLS